MTPTSQYRTPPSEFPASGSRGDTRRGAASAGALCLTTVLGDLGAWLEETERHRTAPALPKKVA